MAPTADSVSELCRDYKSSTNFFIQWLWCQTKMEDPSTKEFASTKDILAAAQVIKKARSVVPKSVISSLRTAIAKRKQVYDIYEKNGAGDHGHAAFCQRLEDTLSILSSLTSSAATSSSSYRFTESEQNAVTLNAFAPLAATVEDIEDDASETSFEEHSCDSDVVNEATFPTLAAPNSDDPDSDDSNFVLEDDALRQFYESANFLLELSNVYSQLEAYWRDAASGKVSLPIASWLTSLATYNIAKNAPSSFFNLCQGLSTKCNTCPTCPGVKFFIAKMSPSPAAAADNIARGIRIHNIAKAINRYGAELPGMSSLWLGKVCSDNCMCRVRTNSGETETYELEETEEALLRETLELVKADLLGTRGIAHLERIKKCPVQPDRTYQSEPLSDFARAFFACKNHLTPGPLIFAMDLFLLTAKSTAVPGGLLSPNNCRMRPLRLAIDMHSAVDEVIEFLTSMRDFANWSQTVDYLKKFRSAAKAFAGEVAFDKYHGSPWTAGNHVTELLTQATLIGTNVAWDWAIINSTLHLYNAMSQSTILRVKKIPLLDELAEVLGQDTFRGVRPKRNFASSFSRTVYQSKIDKTQARVQWGFGLKPLRGQHLMWFLHQHREGHHAGLDWLGDVHGVAPVTKLRCGNCRVDPKKDRSIREAHRSHTLSEYVDHAKNKVLPEMEGEVPISRLNFFGLFVYCGQFMKKFGELSESTLAKAFDGRDLDREIWAHPLNLAVIATELVLGLLDDGPNIRAKRREVKKNKLVEAAGQAFKELDAEATLGQFVWEV